MEKFIGPICLVVSIIIFGIALTQPNSKTNDTKILSNLDKISGRIDQLKMLSDENIEKLNQRIDKISLIPQQVQTNSGKQCNPVFNRGDIVRHKGLPEQNYVVVRMNNTTCDVYIRHPNLTGLETGSDLLEKVN